MRKRDRGVCRACGLDTNRLRREVQGRGRTRRLRELGFLPRRSLWELDHVVPLIDGGSHDPSNLQTLCVPCHRRKSAEEARARAWLRGEERIERAVGAAEDAFDALLARADAANARVRELLSGD